MVLLCNLLGAQVLLHSDRIIGSPFDSSIIRNYNTFHPVRCTHMVLWTIISCILLTDVTMHTYWLYCMLLTLTPDQYHWLCLLQEPPLYHITDSQQTGRTQEMETYIHTKKKSSVWMFRNISIMTFLLFVYKNDFVLTQGPTVCRCVPEAGAFLWMYVGFLLFLHLLWKWQCCVNISVRKCANAATNYPYVKLIHCV